MSPPRSRMAITVAAAVPIAAVVWLVVAVLPRSGDDAGPARGLAAIRVPEGFSVELAAGPELAPYVMFGTLDDRGRLFVSQSTGPNSMTTEQMLDDPSYLVRTLEDLDGDGVFDRGVVFADRIPLPNGGVWLDGQLYVAASPDLLRLTDSDGDGVADERDVVLTGWTLNVNAATLHGPFLGPDGWLYLTDARRGYRIETREGAVLEGDGGRVWRCRPDGTGLEWISAGGFDNPVELVFTPAGEALGTMTFFTDPRAGLRDALMHWVEGGVYPKPHPVIDRDRLKRTGELMPVMTKLANVAPAGLLRYRGGSFGPEYRGDLFSAQFNTHRVMRHVVSRRGATFQTRDEVFLSSSDPHFHPTDVIEDADGSLLVVDTGGWFIKGCPLSRVARPEFHGAIYRVRREGVAPVRDPRGRELKLETLPPAELVRFLEDARPAVRDRAAELAVAAGGAAVEHLTRWRAGSPSPEAGAAAVFALFRIGTDAALRGVRAALDDPSMQVRLAAARALGMAGDAAAVERLAVMAREDEPPVRRQAATALGQIGDPGAVAALLSAAAGAADRFEEHAVIHALIRLAEPGPLRRALSDPSPAVRKAAMIALHEVDVGRLDVEQLATLLEAESVELRQAALWVASRHPHGSAGIARFLRRSLRAPGWPTAEADALREALVSTCVQDAVRSLVAEQLAEPGVPVAARMLLLDVVEACPVDPLPRSWLRSLGRLLDGRSEPGLRLRAVTSIRGRGVGELSARLEAVADGAQESGELRAAALGALLASRSQLDDRHFEFLTGRLRGDLDPSQRLLAADFLARAALSRDQLLVLAREHVARVDPLIRAALLEAFRGESDAEVGRTLVRALERSSSGVDSFEHAALGELFVGFPDGVGRSAEALVERLREVRAARVRRLHELEAELGGGDAARGEQVFFGRTAACSTCHAIGSRGGDTGPDLTAIGAVRSRHDILESIIFPSASFVRQYESHRVTTERELFSGVLRDQTPEAIVLVSGAGSRVRIPRDRIVSIEPSAVSLMPEGLDEGLTRSELADVLAFLEARSGELPGLQKPAR